MDRSRIYKTVPLNSKQIDAINLVRTDFEKWDELLCEVIPPGRYRYMALDYLEKAYAAAVKSVSHDWGIDDD